MTDYRREWIVDRACSYLGMESNDNFNDMFQFGDDDLEDLFSAFLEDELSRSEPEKWCFYLYRTPYERLMEREILVPEIRIHFCGCKILLL